MREGLIPEFTKVNSYITRHVEVFKIQHVSGLESISDWTKSAILLSVTLSH